MLRVFRLTIDHDVWPVPFSENPLADEQVHWVEIYKAVEILIVLVESFCHKILKLVSNIAQVLLFSFPENPILGETFSGAVLHWN